jgi:uncharacterized protein (TIGR00255 family)
MSVISMTGFGRGVAHDRGVKVTVELGTVNRKQFDCQINLPRSLACLEAKLQSLIHAAVARGHVKGGVEVIGEGAGGGLRIDEDRARHAVAALRRLARRLELPDDLAASDLLRLPDLIRTQAQPADPLDLWALIEPAASQALAKLNAMRRREGRALERDIRRRLAALKRIVRSIRVLAPRVPKACWQAREARLRGLNAPPAQALDAALMARELAIFADRCDISEELTRLASHFDQAENFLSGAEPCGRSMDFLCQEMFREINTAGTKANDAAITRLVVRFKTGLESVREQVQNVE